MRICWCFRKGAALSGGLHSKHMHRPQKTKIRTISNTNCNLLPLFPKFSITATCIESIIGRIDARFPLILRAFEAPAIACKSGVLNYNDALKPQTLRPYIWELVNSWPGILSCPLLLKDVVEGAFTFAPVR